MKKIVAVVFSAALFLGLGSQVYASENVPQQDDLQQVLAMIDKSNQDIEEKIEKAVAKADKLQEDYLLDIQKIEEGDQVVKLQNEKEKVLADLEKAKHDEKKADELNKKLQDLDKRMNEEREKIHVKMADIQGDIEEATAQLQSPGKKDDKELNDKLNKLQNQLDKKTGKYEERTKKFTEELEKIIQDVYDETLKISNETIAKAAEKGVVAEQYWVQVEFAGKLVWIDPVRVVGP
ncbi:hypothetical protein [Falsibacillus albus]|uniref:Uncharacterized protein n=1 Tax=Falsibacillus albus TaxID=2478915 RepID=A0A3L7JNC0_9BACI|nr:hypothetical protein [Falsibacillus albus]RLQ92318.1 hypothetical protein D9X91_19795 [Falsibacillus albus]